MRYAGLTPEGVKAAVEILREEEMDPAAEPKRRPLDAPAPGAAKFPEFLDPVQSAIDQRGKQMPAFEVETWVTPAPNPGDRLVVVDFWATWCGPCVKAIPHMNELATNFAADACFVGLSDESRSKFEEGMRKRNLKERDFKYSLALDTNKRLLTFFGVKGIPHCVITSADGIVRWQGSPYQLTPAVMQSLVAANRGLSQSKSGASSSKRSWKSAAPEGKPSGGTGGGAPSRRRGY